MGERFTAIAVVLCCLALPLRAAEEAPAARDYFNSLLTGLDAIELELDTTTQQADRDAARLIDGAPFAVRGDRGLAMELSSRPGAMQSYLGAPTEVGDVVYDATDGDPALVAARAWVYQVELFAACVRRDHTPVIRQSSQLDTRRRRLLRYGNDTFHHDAWPDHAEPGVHGRRYLDGLRRVLRDVGTASWDELAAAVDRAQWARRVLVVTGPSMLAYHLPDGFEPWIGEAGEGDLVLAVGDFEAAGYHGHWPDLDAMRRAELGVVWIVNAQNTRQHELQPGEVLLDLWAPFGDGVVKVGHYDTRLGPVTGVAQLAVVHAIAQSRRSPPEAERGGQQQHHQQPEAQRR